MTTTLQRADAVLSVRTTHTTRARLQALAKATHRTGSSLANEALEQYVAHHDWLSHEIERGVQAAHKGELVPNDTISAWITSIKK